jgi:hypothetical protein
MSKRSLSSTDDLLIDFCDYDKNWSFLLFLRPRPEENIGPARALAAAVLLGMPLGMFGSILVSLVARELGKPAPALLVFPALLIAIYFCVAQLTLFRAWNRRAAQLARVQRVRRGQ